MHDPKIVERVLKSPRLPSLPAIALEVIDLVQRPDVNIDQIADTIQQDPALSSRILKTVNSSFYGLSHSVGTISQALVILGLSSVKTLALGFSLVNNLKDTCSEGFDHMMFWKRSLYSAVAAKSLAKEANIIDQEEAFLAALLQDVGMLAMAQTLGSSYHQLVAQTGRDHSLLIALEHEHLGTDHPQIGSALATQWNLPSMLIHPVRYHEDPLAGPEDFGQLIKCVALGGQAASVFVSETPGEALQAYYRHAEQWLGLTKEQTEPLLNGIHRDTVEMRRLFDLPAGDFDNPDEILASANEALTQLSLQVVQQTNQLEEKNKVLQHQATTDSLTGAANRGHFNQFIKEQFAAASAEAPLSLMFLDADHFKQFNDTYGHPLGDRVLVELAGVLHQQAPAQALVARYGGEEFAVVIPQANRTAAARIAESTRKAIEATPFMTDDGQKLSITASIGVASHDGQVFVRPEQLIKAADKAVYVAKRAGRNCVRIFTPRPVRVA